MTTPTEWDAAVASGSLLAQSLEDEGFIHGSFVHQVERSANKHFVGVDDLILVELESTALEADFVIEDSYGSGQRFPHVYGAINANAVTGTFPLKRNSDARFVLPEAVATEVLGLSPDYPSARHRFLLGAYQAGAEITSHHHPERGLDGGELWLDVAVIGPDTAEHTVLVTSGVHGVEGFAGSALQSRWLHYLGTLPDDRPYRIVLVHALNPFGFSWVRRVNEDNVDLNRNFPQWANPPTNEAYREIAGDLVPDAWDEPTQEASTLALLSRVEEVGFEAMQAIISSGQYEFPTGVFYGGTGPTWSNRWLHAELQPLLGGATRVTLIDLHTGLGEWGVGELMTDERVGTVEYERGTALWGSINSMHDGESSSAVLEGDWLSALDALAPGVEWTAICLEFGTVDPITVMQALRADAWLHAHGEPRSVDGENVRAQVRAAFADDDPAWFEKIARRFDEVVGAIDARLSQN